MKSFGLLTCLVLAGAQGDAEWEAWKFTHGRQYVSAEEEVFRRKVFTQKIAHAQYMQQLNPLATFGSDEFSDWTEEEERAELFGAIPQEMAADMPQAKVDMTTQIPTDKNWTGIATTPVKSQKCGSCWANSATEQIESDFMLQKGKQFILSPQEAVDCTGNKTFRNGCSGGWPDGAYKAFMQLGGLELEATYPDEGIDPKTKKPVDLKCLYSQSKAVVTLKGYQAVGTKDEPKMRQYVATTGPLSVCVLAAWGGYKGGVLTGCPSHNGTNHCVQIVGYGNDKGQDYWNVRNSWGPKWGEHGHIRLAFGSNQCDINGYPSSTIAGNILPKDDAVVV